MSCLLTLTALFALHLGHAQDLYGGVKAELIVKPLSEEIHGRTIRRRGYSEIYIDPRVCEGTRVYQEFIVIHELGHAIDYGINPRYRTDEDREKAADKYGRTLWDKDTPFLSEVTARCEKGVPWACNKQEIWRKP